MKVYFHIFQCSSLTEAGNIILYVYPDAAHKNPLRRVIPLDLISEGEEHDYDKQKYREMLLDAAETILAIYGDAIKKKDRKWWKELRWLA